MDEGFADLFTVSKDGHWLFGGPLSGYDPTFPANEGVTARVIWNEKTMANWDFGNDPFNTPHKNGLIISGALYKLRSDIGDQGIALAYDALAMEPPAFDYLDYRERLHAADGAANAHANRAAIEVRFVERGIGGPVPPSFLAGGVVGSSIDLLWNDLSQLEDNYVVQRSIQGGSWSTRATLSAGATAYSDPGIPCVPKTYSYRIKAVKDTLESFSPIADIDPCGGGGGAQLAELPAIIDVVTAAELQSLVPSLELTAYPSPVQDRLTVVYETTTRSYVHLEVVDLLGRLVAVLEDYRPEGRHERRIDTSDWTAGTYIVRIRVGEESIATTIVVLP